MSELLKHANHSIIPFPGKEWGVLSPFSSNVQQLSEHRGAAGHFLELSEEIQPLLACRCFSQVPSSGPTFRAGPRDAHPLGGTSTAPKIHTVWQLSDRPPRSKNRNGQTQNRCKQQKAGGRWDTATLQREDANIETFWRADQSLIVPLSCLPSPEAWRGVT